MYYAWVYIASESHWDKWELCYWQATVPVKLWRVLFDVSKAGKYQPHHFLVAFHWFSGIISLYQAVSSHSKVQYMFGKHVLSQKWLLDLNLAKIQHRFWSISWFMSIPNCIYNNLLCL